MVNAPTLTTASEYPIFEAQRSPEFHLVKAAVSRLALCHLQHPRRQVYPNDVMEIPARRSAAPVSPVPAPASRSRESWVA